MKDKVLVAISTADTPHFLFHLSKTIESKDAGYPFDVVVVDNESKTRNQLRLLERLSRKFKILKNIEGGRSQGSYNAAWMNDKEYRFYFFMHDDSSILKDGWLKTAIDRITSDYVEPELRGIKEISSLPLGKVGFQGYCWGTNKQYLRNQFPAPYPYADEIGNILGIKIPKYWQHINDDRILIRNELLQRIDEYWSVETFRKMKGTEEFNNINNFYDKNFPSATREIPPIEKYGDANYNGFQGVVELLSSIMPVRYGYRSSCVVGDGYVQEDLGYSSFWGLDVVNHYGSHNFFKRMAILLKITESEVKKRLKSESFLNYCDKIILQEQRLI